jgi:hypothetical protein
MIAVNQLINLDETCQYYHENNFCMISSSLNKCDCILLNSCSRLFTYTLATCIKFLIIEVPTLMALSKTTLVLTYRYVEHYHVDLTGTRLSSKQIKRIVIERGKLGLDSVWLKDNFGSWLDGYLS